MSYFRNFLIVSSLLTTVSGAVADIERFEEPSPFDWSLTKYPRTIANSHTLSRPHTDLGTTCIPSGGGFPIEWIGDREGFFTGGTVSDCEAWAFRTAGQKHKRGDSRMTVNIDHTELTGNPQKAGLVSRGQLDWAGGSQGWVLTGVSSGYAAVVTYYPTVVPNGYPTTVTIFKLNGDCLSSATQLRVSPMFYTQCEDQHFLTFDTYETSSGTALLATLSTLSASDPAVKIPIAISAGACPPYSTDANTLCAVDSDPSRPLIGHNGVVADAVGSDAVLMDDVTLSNVAVATFDQFATGTIVGSSTGVLPGTPFFDIDPFFSSDGNGESVGTVAVERFQRPNGVLAFGNATIQNAGANFGSGRICNLDSMNLDMQFNAAIRRVRIDYQYAGAPVNLQVNGSTMYVGSTSSIPAAIAPGISASKVESQDGPIIRGRLTINSDSFDVDPWPIFGLRFGGQSISLDNITVYSDTVISDCDADFNGDGEVDFFDYLDFVDSFSSLSPESDFNGDGSIDFFDYLDFVDAFSVGC